MNMSNLSLKMNVVFIFFVVYGTAFGENIQTPCSASEHNISSEIHLKNGFYLILHEYETMTRESKSNPGEVTIIYDYEFLDPKPDVRPETLVIHEVPEIPLQLEEKPQKMMDEKDKPLLNLQLSAEYIEPLRQFTKTNIMSKVAIVIGGKVISVHKIREEIKDGKIQITRCSSDSCEKLLIELTSSLKN